MLQTTFSHGNFQVVENFIIQKRCVVDDAAVEERANHHLLNEELNSEMFKRNFLSELFFFCFLLQDFAEFLESQNAIHIPYQSSCLLNEKHEKLLHFISLGLVLLSPPKTCSFMVDAERESECKDYAIAVRH